MSKMGAKKNNSGAKFLKVFEQGIYKDENYQNLSLIHFQKTVIVKVLCWHEN